MPLNVALLGTEKQSCQGDARLRLGPRRPGDAEVQPPHRPECPLDKPYAEAPVSPLFVFGRKQDLAFEKPVGENARRRHHVRFWRSTDLGREGVPLWIGAVTFDRSVGLSRTTGQITHHIAPDIDAERDDPDRRPPQKGNG